MGNIEQSCYDSSRRFLKYLLKLWTGKSELARICLNDCHSSRMSTDMARSFINSRMLKMYSEIVFNRSFESFDLESIATSIEDIKLKDILTAENSYSNSLMIANMNICLYSLQFYNATMSKLFGLKSTAFDSKLVAHTALLESLWVHLMPDIRRTTESTASNVASESWKDIGFQGRDPSTDFRGMGFLGLVQLEHFAKTKTKNAKAALAISVSQDCAYFPLCATGINITFFLIELIHERRLYSIVFECLESNSLDNIQTVIGPGGSEDLVCTACIAIHDLYCHLFIDFVDLWVLSKPKDLMEFPLIFTRFKQNTRLKFSPISDP